jgi:hypothetical protein
MTRSTRITTPVFLALALALTVAGCAAPAADPSSSPVPESASSAPCGEVTVVVDFGVLDVPSIGACVSAGPALDALDEAGVSTEGTADYGNAVVCRVNNEPSPDETVTIQGQDPFVESCDTLNATAYWALWVKPSADADWEYAQEGVSTLELAAGQSVGLVYTAGTDSTPPEG